MRPYICEYSELGYLCASPATLMWRKVWDDTEREALYTFRCDEHPEDVDWDALDIEYPPQIKNQSLFMEALQAHISKKEKT